MKAEETAGRQRSSCTISGQYARTHPRCNEPPAIDNSLLQSHARWISIGLTQPVATWSNTRGASTRQRV